MTPRSLVHAAAGALLLVAGLGAPAHAGPQSEALLRDLVAWIDSSPDWTASVASVRSQGDDTILEGLVFQRDEPRFSIGIDKVRVRDLVEQPNGGFTFREAEVTAASLIGEGIDARLPSANATDVSMPSFADAAIDPKHLMSSIARIYGVAASGKLGAISVPEISMVQRQTAPGGDGEIESRVSYSNLRMENLSDGVLRSQELGPLTVTTTKPGDTPTVFRFDKLEADRLDIGAFAHILDPREYRDGRGDGVWRPLVSRILYSGFTGSGTDGASVRIAEIAAENLDARQPEEPFARAWDQLMDPDTPQETRNDIALDALLGMADAFRLGTGRIDSVAVSAGDNGSFKLAGLTLSGFSSAGFDSFIMSGLGVDGPEVHLAFDKLEVAGFVSPDIRALTRFATIEKNEDPEAHARAIAETFAALPRLGHFGIDGLSAGLSPQQAVSLKTLSLDLRDWNKTFAGETDFRVEELRVPRALMELNPDVNGLYDALGYGDLTLGMSLVDRWDPDAGTDEADWSLSMAEAGNLDLSYTLNGLTLDWLDRATAEAAKGADGEAALKAMLADISVDHATLRVTDRSLLDRVFAIVAKEQGLTISGPDYREQMRAALPFIIGAVVPAELAQRFAPPLQDFMAGGQTLLANIAPPSPLGVLDLASAAADPLTLPDRLNLTLSSEEAKE